VASIEKQETSRGLRYNVRYRDPTGRPREKVFRRQKDAARFARQVEVDKDRGLFIDPAMARTPLAEVASAWLASNPAKRDGSWQRDEIAIRRHIAPVLGDRPIGALTPSDVQALVNRWSAARAPRTVRRDYGVLQSIINYAVRLDMLGRSPCRGINLPRAKPLRRKVVDAADLARLAKALGGVGALGPMVYLGAVEGLRWGEVAGLRVGQVDVEARTVAVVETIVRGRKGAVGMGEPKSDAGRRTLPVPSGLADMLSDHMAASGLTPADHEALLFTSPGGGLLRYTNWLRRSWYPATIAAGLGRLIEDEATGRRHYVGLGFHDLRRASATSLVAAGVDVKTAQAVLGHSDARLTLDHYAQVVTERQRAAADAMGARFFDGSPRGERGAEPSSGHDPDPPENDGEGL
jgi:integrase